MELYLTISVAFAFLRHSIAPRMFFLSCGQSINSANLVKSTFGDLQQRWTQTDNISVGTWDHAEATPPWWWHPKVQLLMQIAWLPALFHDCIMIAWLHGCIFIIKLFHSYMMYICMIHNRMMHNWILAWLQNFITSNLHPTPRKWNSYIFPLVNIIESIKNSQSTLSAEVNKFGPRESIKFPI